MQKAYSDLSSLLRVIQGHEIDFVKTGTRWQMSNNLRKHLKQLPYFLLYNYPAKLKKYHEISKKNKLITEKESKIKLNAYHSPSPMNELCDYICSWEKKSILWNNSIQDLIDTKCLVLDSSLNLNDKYVLKITRHYINDYAQDLKSHLKSKNDDSNEKNTAIELLTEKYKTDLQKELNLGEEIIANYVINVSYNSFSISKSFAWSAYADYIIKNLKNNTHPQKNVTIVETQYPSDKSYEYLGKYYDFKDGDNYL